MSCVIDLMCRKCKRHYPLGTLYACECGGFLSVNYNYDKAADAIDRKQLEERTPSVWKYKELLPVTDDSAIITLGEGGTRLHRCKRLQRELGLRNLYLKDETRNPTASFKDRPITIGVSKAVEDGANTLAVVSSGNAASSLAAYSALAGAECYIMVPSMFGTAAGKLAKMSVFDVHIALVRGTCYEVVKMFEKICKKHNWYPVFPYGGINPYPLEGTKTIAYEICEQMGWKAPERVVIPVGLGDNLTGEWKGFKEYQELDFIEDLPAMFGIQIKGSDPLARAFKGGKERTEPMLDPKSIVPFTGQPALDAIRESRGGAETVSEEEALDAVKLLARTEGIFVEPVSASAVAGIAKLVEGGKIGHDDTVVCILTGSGLNEPEEVMKTCKGPPVVELEQIEKGLKSEIE